MTSLLGPLHTLKGNSGMIGLLGVKDYVHRLEDAFIRVRDGSLGLTPAVLQCLFEGASALREAVEAAGAEGGEPRDLGPEKAVLDSLLVAAPVSSSPWPAAPASGGAGRPARPGDTTLAAARSSMVRVDFSKLDQLLNLVGELIVHRTKLTEMARQVRAVAPEAGQELLDSVHQIATVSTQLQETIMDIRMLPIRPVFERFPRLVRDLAHAQNKKIELILAGEGTRVDPVGTILRSAAQESSQVVITLVDDGAGIDAAEVRRHAVERGLLSADETMSDREIVQFIFAEGFSTARAVTDVSGRGVGLDVVVRSMERLNGLIEAETIPGAGTKFTLQLPLTLAIITVLMVEVGDNVFALPSGAVVESLRIRQEEVSQMNGRDTLRVRDRIIPILHLADFFGVASEARGEGAYAVIVGRGEKRLGLSVDRLLGQQDVVIKGLDTVVSGAGLGVAGATILGDGRVVLVVDVAALFETSRGRSRGVTPVGTEA